MAEHSHIEWTDATWNPITGCTMVSAGCTNCYAMGLAATRLRDHPSRAGLTRITGGRPVWTGEVRLNEGWLDQPLRWRRPRRIFVCAHGDLFHEAVPDDWIDMVFAVMGEAMHHTYQVLTKRPDRMASYMRSRKQHDPVKAPIGKGLMGYHPFNHECRVPANIWLGTSVEDQATADARIPHLLATPAAVRFLSCEPLLGPVDLTRITEAEQARPGDATVLGWYLDALTGDAWDDENGALTGEYRDTYGTARLDWVIVGGESGPGARPMHPDWARSLRDQCQAAGVPFFFKQWGDWAPAIGKPVTHRWSGDTLHQFDGGRIDGLGAARVGKQAAGRLLDGRTWDELPGGANA